MHATIRYRNLVGQRYIALTQEVGSLERRFMKVQLAVQELTQHASRAWRGAS